MTDLSTNAISITAQSRDENNRTYTERLVYPLIAANFHEFEQTTDEEEQKSWKKFSFCGRVSLKDGRKKDQNYGLVLQSN